MGISGNMVVDYLIRLAFTVWLLLLVYNFISALFGIDRLRRLYVDLLRELYAVSFDVEEIFVVLITVHGPIIIILGPEAGLSKITQGYM